MLLIGRAAREIRLNQTEGLPRSGQWQVTGMEFQQSFRRVLFSRGKHWNRREMSAAFLGYEARWTVACKLVWPIYISIYSYFETGCRKKARDNPDRYCGWFWVPFPSKKFGRMAGEVMDVCLRVLKESNKSRFDSCSVRKSVLIISHRDCQVHFFFRQSFSK